MTKEEIIQSFNIPGKLIQIFQLDKGNIHKTYVATYEKDGEEHKYLVQQINNYVFKNPYEVMDNIEKITKHLQKELDKVNDRNHKTLKVINTIDNKNMLVCKNENSVEEFYRVYDFIDNAISYDDTTNPEIVKSVGKAFGNFQKFLSNFPAEELSETIVDFHNTKNRLISFEKSIKEDEFNKVNLVNKEIDFILSRKNICSLIVDKLDNNEIPYRVAHNDTKVNNVMLNKQDGEFLAVVDLDTAMPGSVLYDYGDGVRSAASNALEDEKDLNKVYLNKLLFENFTDGYLSELAPYLTENEVKLMGQSIKLITLELGMRFLNDYICGDKYFKCNYETHNLDRAKNQLKLVEDIENQMDYINSYIWEAYKKYLEN